MIRNTSPASSRDRQLPMVDAGRIARHVHDGMPLNPDQERENVDADGLAQEVLEAGGSHGFSPAATVNCSGASAGRSPRLNG